ncbi:MAG: DUF922 domain-containing Zn-dependent protease [Gammaproteobacteria bacterium]
MSKFSKFFCCLFFVSITTLAEPIPHEAESMYKIQGSTAEELRTEMNHKGIYDQDRRYDADTRWYIKWRYDYNEGRDQCSLSKVQVTVDVTYYLPLWVDYKNADPALQNRWNDYMTNLRTHEIGHAENGKNAAVEIETTLLNFPVMENCDELGKAANAKANSIVAKYNAEDIQYDSETKHGKIQGAVFP